MKAYIKSFSAFRTVLSLDALSWSLCLESVESEGSTVTVVGELPRSHAGSWLIIDNKLYLIDKITPQDGRTLLSLLSPEDAFSRLLPYAAPASAASIGGYVKAQLEANWLNQTDGVYAMSYLEIFNVDATAFSPPVTDDNGLFSLSEYIRRVRRFFNVRVAFTAVRDSLKVSITKVARPHRNIIFGDGHTELSTAAYSRSGVAKITAVQPVDTGQEDEAGEPVFETTYTDWYLSSDGVASIDVPANRAAGEWITLPLRAKEDQFEKVQERFDKNSASHKVEFWADRRLNALDDCDFKIYGERLSSYISYVGQRSTDRRFFYRSGELATTAVEKLKGVNK